MWYDHVIWYANPRSLNSPLKLLKTPTGKRVIVKGRTKKEAEKRAQKKLKTTGMVYQVERLTPDLSKPPQTLKRGM